MNYRIFLLAFICLWFPGKMLSQKLDPKIEAIEKHYQYLENESTSFRESMQSENDAYRKFIQEERAEHQKFLERTYTIGGILITLIASILTFFGLNTFNGFREAQKNLEAAYTGRLLAFENSMSDYRIRFTDAQQNLRKAEEEYNGFLNYYRNANPKKGRYLLISSSEKLKSMETNELIRFDKAFGIPEKAPIEEFDFENFYPASYDLIVYRSNADKEGEDTTLQSIIGKLKSNPEIPVVIYASGQQEYIKGATDRMLRENCLFHLATTPVSFIDNVASAYRAAKMLPRKKETA